MALCDKLFKTAKAIPVKGMKPKLIGGNGNIKVTPMTGNTGKNPLTNGNKLENNPVTGANANTTMKVPEPGRVPQPKRVEFTNFSNQGSYTKGDKA